MSLALPHAPYLDAVHAALESVGWPPDVVALQAAHRPERGLTASLAWASGLELTWSDIDGWRCRRPGAPSVPLPLPDIADPADIAAVVRALLHGADVAEIDDRTARWGRAQEMDQLLADHEGGMTTDPRIPLADHGTTARAKGRPARGIAGCPCDPCRDAERRYDKRRRVLNATGRALMVDSQPAADHLRRLLSAGAGWNQLAAASGCSSSSMSAILRGLRPTIRRTTADKLLSLRAGDCIPGRRMVDATGSIRRVRALQAIGHTCKVIARVAGVDHTVTNDLLNSRPRELTRRVADSIGAAYEQLRHTDPSDTGAHSQGVSRAKIRARREGWADPTWWEDYGGLDDPSAPETEPDDLPGAHTVARYVAAEIQHLARYGLPVEDIARRVGHSPKYVREQIAGTRAPGWRDRQRGEVAA